MGGFCKIETGIEGLVLIEPTCFDDARGFFMESYHQKSFKELGILVTFVQDNHSSSKKGVLRGLHFQTEQGQDKLVRVTRGRVYDVAVDLRENSPTYGRWFGVELTAENRRMLFIPKGFAHGFLALEESSEFLYKVSDYYHPGFDAGIHWNDPFLNITWPLHEVERILCSPKDEQLPLFRDVCPIKESV